MTMIYSVIILLSFFPIYQPFFLTGIQNKQFQYHHTQLNVATPDKTKLGRDINIDIPSINRGDFPILSSEPYAGKKLVYLDSGASSQKPTQVLEKMDDYYRTSHSNVHRGAHALAIKATTLYEWARDQVRTFINARHREEIVFTRGASEAINIVAMSFSTTLKQGDEIILSVMEHHSNLVPWQMAAQRTGAVLKFVNLTSTMEFDYDHYLSLLSPRTKMVAISHSSNVLGSINPVRDIVRAAHEVGARVLVDACQSVPHMPVDVQALDADFLVASSHKMCGPTGIGFLYGKLDLLSSLPPVYGGGEMIDRVDLFSSTYALPPSRFEAGTPAIAEAVGLGAACEYLTRVGMSAVLEHDVLLGAYLHEQLSQIDGLSLYGPTPKHSLAELQTLLKGPTGRSVLDGWAASSLTTTEGVRTGLVAFNSAAVHPTDLSFFLDQEGVALRTGHHCTQPLHRQLGIPASIRASVYLYNDKNDVDIFVEKLKDTLRMFENMK